MRDAASKPPEGTEEELQPEEFAAPFLAGSNVVHLPPDAAIKFERDLQKHCAEVFERHRRGSRGEAAPFTVTFAIMPSRAIETNESRNTLESEPSAHEHTVPARHQVGRSERRKGKLCVMPRWLMSRDTYDSLRLFQSS